jgi:ureidoacrylate peracid hydrolase
MMWFTSGRSQCINFPCPRKSSHASWRRVGRTHPFDKLEASKTAFVVIDMQNYYLKPGYLGDVPLAHDIVPAAAVVAVGDY